MKTNLNKPGRRGTLPILRKVTGNAKQSPGEYCFCEKIKYSK
jgi:hypothetical protein